MAENPYNTGPKFPPITPNLQRVLQYVVDDIVERLGFVGALIATLEEGKALPVRAFTVDFNPKLLNQLESSLGVSLLGPQSVVFLEDSKYKKNISVTAIQSFKKEAEKYVISNELYDLLRPIIRKGPSDLAQRMVGIKQIIAMPFILDGEPVGNLIAAKRSDFTPQDIDFLTVYSRQAAISLQSQQHLVETRALERIILALQASMTNETQVLELMADALVQRLGYAGTMVATLEPDNSLPVRAFAKDFDSSLLDYLEEKLGISPISPRSVVYLDDPAYQDNLSVKAVKGLNGVPEKYLVSSSLHDLFRPIVSRPLSNLAQRLVGIRQVIAVPFFLDGVVVGNLFAATRKPQFSEQDITILIAFGQQAAVGIRNARLYQKAEERRQIAQMFARMAFSAAASVHALRNHIGAFQTFIGLVRMFPKMSTERFGQILNSTDELKQRLNESAHLLENMHRPWQLTVDELTDVNACLGWAIAEVFPETRLKGRHAEVLTHDGIKIHLQLTDNLLQIMTVPDMLTEAFRVLIKNGLEALRESDRKQPTLWISSQREENARLGIYIRDNGVGIKTADLAKIFEMGWSSKKGEGMGFGLFWTKDYIEGLGGSIKVKSALNEGTTFSLSLPSGNQ